MAAAGSLSAPLGFLGTTVVPVTLELMRTFPDSLVIASGIFALLTMSMPFGIFFGSMIESTLLFRALRYVAKSLNIGMPSTTKTDKTRNNSGTSDLTVDASKSGKCRTGFTLPTLNTLSMFGSDTMGSSFPSAPIFMLSTASAYLFGSLNHLSTELQALGPSYSSRYYISAILLMLLIFIFSAFRILNGCESIGTIILTIPFGLILGFVLIQQNSRLFGEQSVNLVGIPLLRNRTASGKNLYVCSGKASGAAAAAT